MDRKMKHELKTWPKYFHQILIGNKTFEARKNDRDFKVGDELILREWDPTSGYTPQMVTRKVTHILYGPGWGVEAGYCVMSLNNVNFKEDDLSEHNPDDQN